MFPKISISGVVLQEPQLLEDGGVHGSAVSCTLELLGIVCLGWVTCVFEFVGFTHSTRYATRGEVVCCSLRHHAVLGVFDPLMQKKWVEELMSALAQYISIDIPNLLLRSQVVPIDRAQLANTGRFRYQVCGIGQHLCNENVVYVSWLCKCVCVCVHA